MSAPRDFEMKVEALLTECMDQEPGALHVKHLTCCVDASGRHGAVEGRDLGRFLRFQLCNRLLFDWGSRGRCFGERRWENVPAILRTDAHTHTQLCSTKPN